MKIVLNKGQRIWFTSDTHYSHSNICSATTIWDKDRCRQFNSLDKMNDTIVNNINELVGEDDILIHLGDWSFGGFDKIKEFRDRIICKNIHIVLGNHDHHILRNKEDIRDIFTSVKEYLFLNVRRPSETGKMDKFSFVCMHYPISSWNGMGDGVYHLHGHVHLPKELRTGEGRHMDVGVDGNDLKPISMEEVLSILSPKPYRNLIIVEDHHEKV